MLGNQLVCVIASFSSSIHSVESFQILLCASSGCRHLWGDPLGKRSVSQTPCAATESPGTRLSFSSPKVRAEGGERGYKNC